MRSSVLAGVKNLVLAPYTAGSQSRKQRHIEAFLPLLELGAQTLFWWQPSARLISISFSRNPFADVGRTILQLEAVRFAVLEKADCVSVHKGEVF
jgi:hypothetical protein